MQSKTIRISPETHSKLRDLTARTGESMQSVVDRAVKELYKREFWEHTNAAFAKLREDSDAWKDEQDERSEWDRIPDN